MIGQVNIKKQLSEKKLPQAMILIGPTGSGKRTLLLELFNGIYPEDNKIASIRSIINMSYTVRDNIFIIPNANELSAAAQNALLKVLEESPNNNKFILTAEDTNQVLPTIVSRCEIYNMDNYTPDEIFNYYWTVADMPNDAEIVRIICETPGEVKKCIDMCDGHTVQSFYDFVVLVVDNIAEVSGANVFKIADRISLKSEQTDKYDLKLFWKAFILVCYDKFLNNELTLEQINKAIVVTESCISQLRYKGINKQMLFDIWLLDIRKGWM